MRITGVAKLYWRKIKAGERTIESVKDLGKKNEIWEIANAEVKNGMITPEEFETYIGEDYLP